MLAHLLPHVTLRRFLLSPAQLRPRSAHLVYAPRRSQDQLTRNRQLLTRGPKGVPPKARGPESVTTVHSQPHRQMRRLEPSPSRLRIFPLPSSHPSSLLSLRSLSHLSSKTFLSRSYSRYLHPRMQNSAHHEAPSLFRKWATSWSSSTWSSHWPGKKVMAAMSDGQPDEDADYCPEN